MLDKCPVCLSFLRKSDSREDRVFIECLRCGPYSLNPTEVGLVGSRIQQASDGPARVSHALYSMSRREQWVFIDNNRLSAILDQTALPRPGDQVDNLITWLGDNQTNIGSGIEAGPAAIAAVGAADETSLVFVITHAIAAGLVKGDVIPSMGGTFAISPLQLSIPGWERFDEIRRGEAASRVVFMAMPFGNLELDHVYETGWKPAVEAAGFRLKRLDEHQPAGLIDDRLRVEIRQSRFLIAELTGQNQGAYWEAGFAEGLGKPVIYTCRRDVFENKSTAPHFDTNHHLTVVWTVEQLSEASEKLKATIRATLPSEARQSD